MADSSSPSGSRIAGYKDIISLAGYIEGHLQGPQCPGLTDYITVEWLRCYVFKIPGRKKEISFLQGESFYGKI